jgi:succinylglutamic semialdehyde dehydrogenase
MSIKDANITLQSKGNFINGSWVPGRGFEFGSYNPANNEKIWNGNCANEQQLDQAIDAAREASYEWANTSLDVRIKKVEDFASLVESKLDTITNIIAEETGKPLWEAAQEAKSIYTKAGISIEAHTTRTGDSEQATPLGTSRITYKPHGVIAVFGPYNFPGHLPNGHIIPALLAGNTVIFKPSDFTPKIAEFIVSLWHESGLPKGVINLLQGGIAIGKELSTHLGIDGVFFTGSSNTGKSIHKHYAEKTGKILALEMGGNNPLIVTELDNIKAALYNCIQSAFITTGQRCTCARRLFIPKGKWGDNFLTDLINATSNIVIGSWNDDPQPFIGPVISKFVAKNTVNIMLFFEQMGAKVLLKSKHIDENTGFVSPGIIDITSIKDTMADEENFAPILKVIRYETFDEALYWANNTNYGLSAGLLSEDKNLYQTFYKKIRAGIVNWNMPTTGASGKAPFGGIGDSGNLRPSAYFAADYCSYPVAGIESTELILPEKILPGIKI